MEELSGNDSGSTENFFKVIFENKTEWTDHIIPIRFLDYNYYQEGYLYSAGSKKDAKSIQVLNAWLPTSRPSEIFVTIANIYPSSRKIKGISTDQSKVFEEEYCPFLSNIKPPPLLITPTTVDVFFKRFAKESWTLHEVFSCFGIEEDQQKCSEITKLIEAKNFSKGTKRCLICNSIETSYSEKRQEIMNDSLEAIVKEYSTCTSCTLGTSRNERKTQIVPHGGKFGSVAMIIGEAPGRQEEENLIPFFKDAPAGGLLHRVIAAAGGNIDDFFYTNTVICRPYAIGNSENRTPVKDEIKACNSRLKRVLRLASPKLVVLTGSTAYKAFFGLNEITLRDVLGWQTKMDGEYILNFEIFVTYHPSAIARELTSAKDNPEKRLSIQKGYLDHWTMIIKRMKELQYEV